MPFAERLKLIKRIEELRGSQLFCYLTSVGTFSQEGWWSGQFASFAPKFRRCHKSLLNRALSAPNLRRFVFRNCPPLIDCQMPFEKVPVKRDYLRERRGVRRRRTVGSEFATLTCQVGELGFPSQPTHSQGVKD
jgi:hypothetical protein